MPNQQLIEYIKQAKEAGQDDEKIKSDLRGAGWQEGDIEEGFGVVSSSVSPPLQSSLGIFQVLSEQKSRKIFLVFAIFGAFLIVGISGYFILSQFKGKKITEPIKKAVEKSGANWIQVTSNAPETRDATLVVYKNKMWLMEEDDVWYSTDGINWTNTIQNYIPIGGGYRVVKRAGATWTGRRKHTAVVYDNKMWVMGGERFSDVVQKTILLNDVWYSTDGVSWIQATANAAWSAREGHTSVVFDNKIWVVGGDDSSRKDDVWYSSDGANWIQATANAAWPAREGHTSVVYDNKMWVIGSYYAPFSLTLSNDVWYSTDGINWIQATENAAWPGRDDHTSIVYDNKMWVMGGRKLDDPSKEHPYGEYRINDVWYSADGINWIQATENAAWPGRDDHTSIVYDNKMWVMGGLSGGGNDVWYSF